MQYSQRSRTRGGAPKDSPLDTSIEDLAALGMRGLDLLPNLELLTLVQQSLAVPSDRLSQIANRNGTDFPPFHLLVLLAEHSLGKNIPRRDRVDFLPRLCVDVGADDGDQSRSDKIRVGAVGGEERGVVQGSDRIQEVLQRDGGFGLEVRDEQEGLLGVEREGM